MGREAKSNIEERNKINSNYETIRILKDKLAESKGQQKIGMTRAAYIKMVFEVTNKVNKQNVEFSKIITETRRLQRDISNLTGRLDRSFLLVETTIFKDAKNDGWSRECYRLLNTMHESCNKLLQAVQDTGEITREIRQLEDQIGQHKISQTFASI